MDVRQYFNPVNFSKFTTPVNYTWKYSLGQIIEKSTMAFSETKKNTVNIAIVGVPFFTGSDENDSSESVDIIRKHLYHLATFDQKVSIVDFGNLKAASSKKGTYLALRDIIEFFNDINATTIVIGGSHDLSYGISLSYRTHKFFTLTVVDALLNVKTGRETFHSSNFLSKIFSENPHLFQFNLVGFQSHLVPSALFAKTKGISDHVRLGVLKENINNAEPIFRNSDFVSFDFTAIKNSEIKGKKQNYPNGLLSDEACQLAKFAGFSNRIKTFGIFDVYLDSENENLSGSLAAEMTWYFIEGYLNRAETFENSRTNKTKYKVEISGLDQPLVFYECKNTNRWWFEILTINDERIFIACSKKIYTQATENEIPELWLKYMQKTEEVLK